MKWSVCNIYSCIFIPKENTRVIKQLLSKYNVHYIYHVNKTCKSFIYRAIIMLSLFIFMFSKNEISLQKACRKGE